MNNEKKLTAQDLALYYRGQAKLISRAEKLDSFHGFAHVGQIVVIDSILLASVEQGLYEVKPILRPLSDMTEDEARSVWGKCYGDDFGDGECLLHLIATVDSDERNDSEFDVLLGYPDGWRYLLSRHFDLFGWIEAGLAIDKTKIETK
jgi:hypothetical protein